MDPGPQALTVPILGTNVPNMGIRNRTAKRARRPARRTPGLADALFSKSQQRVLGVLFGNSGRSYYLTEIISLAKTGRGAVQREVANLAASGLITVTPRAVQFAHEAGGTAFADLGRSAMWPRDL